MTNRIPLDTITSDALDQLYAERDRLRAELDRTYRRHDSSDALQYALGGLAHHCARAEQAEAAIERVRARCQRVRDRVGPSGMINASQILGLLSPTWPDGNHEAPAVRTALDPQEPQP